MSFISVMEEWLNRDKSINIPHYMHELKERKQITSIDIDNEPWQILRYLLDENSGGISDGRNIPQNNKHNKKCKIIKHNKLK